MSANSHFKYIVRNHEPVSLDPCETGKSGAWTATYGSGLKALVKFDKPVSPSGRSEQRGIPISTHPRREVAYYEMSKLFGFSSIVPETCLIDLKGRRASAQEYKPALHLEELNAELTDRSDYRSWKHEFSKTVRQYTSLSEIRQMVILDIVSGQRDRHANNLGVVPSLEPGKPGKLVVWDNAAAYGMTFKLYHNVFHKHLFR
jgi:hypothetical protein